MIEERVYILSDLHLNLLPSDKRYQLLEFMNRIVAEKATSLYLNGDIFDLMVPQMEEGAWEDVFKFAQILHKMADNGTHIHYILGNHDLPLLLHFPDFSTSLQDFIDVHSERIPVEIYSNFNLHYRSTSFDFAGKKIYIEHGHIYDLGWVPGKDWNQAWKTAASLELSGPWFENIFKLWEVFQKSGEDYSVRILRTGSHLPPAIYVRREGTRLASTLDYDWVFLSHFHSPLIEELGNERVFANSGDSLQHGSYISLVDQEIRICDWREVLGL